MDPFRARYDAKQTKGSVEGMSPLDHSIIRNRIRSRVIILCQLMENISIEGPFRAKFPGLPKQVSSHNRRICCGKNTRVRKTMAK